MRNKKLIRKKYGSAASYILSRKGNTLPWAKTLQNIKQRCTNPNDKRYKYYGGKGIKCLVTLKDMKETFYRDRAWTLEHPSIDRKNPKKNYTLKNIRWIEMNQNRKSDAKTTGWNTPDGPRFLSIQKRLLGRY